MDNFDFKKYLAENRIHADHDLINEKKEDSKKGNKEEQKRMEGAIRDNEIHIDKLNKDKKADKKKLAKLKADEPKDVSEAQGYNDRDDEAIGAKDGAEKDKKVSMKGRRDMSRGMEKALGKKSDSTDSKMDEAETQTEAKEFKNDEAEKAYEDLDAAINNFRAMSNNAFGDAAGDKMKEFDKSYQDMILALKDVEMRMNEVEEDDIKKEEMSSKMKVSELKAKIREDILSTLGETVTEEEDVDVDVDFEDEVNVDAEGDDIEIDRPAVKAKVNVGLSPEEEIIQDSLKAAMDAADSIGNDKLADQIGNTITFFTREYVVGRN